MDQTSISFGDQSKRKSKNKKDTFPTPAKKKWGVRDLRHKLTDESRNFSTFSEFQNFNIVIRSSRVGYLSKPKSCDVWNQYGEISQTYYIQALLYYFVYLGQLFKIINLTISTRSYDDYEAFGTVGVRSYSSYIQPWTKNESCQRSYNFGEHIQWKFEGILGSFIHSSAIWAFFGVHSFSHHAFVFNQYFKVCLLCFFCISTFLYLSIFLSFLPSASPPYLILPSDPKFGGPFINTYRELRHEVSPHALIIQSRSLYSYQAASLLFHDEMNKLLYAPFFKVHWIKDNPDKYLRFKLDGLAVLRYVAVLEHTSRN